MATIAFLKRLRFQMGGEEHCLYGSNSRRPDDGLRVEMGPVTGAWYDMPLPACPDCGGTLMWAEGGYVPGARLCIECGAMFIVETQVMQQKHSPAPWISCGNHVDDSRGITLFRSTRTFDDVNPYDFHLAAEAPELLECCKALLEMAQLVSDGMGETWRDRIARASAAIAKAEGGRG